jgi:hypothetical protein
VLIHGVVSFLPFQTVCPFFGTNRARSEDSDHDLFFPFQRIMSAVSQRCVLSCDHHVSLLTGFSESSPKPWKILFATSLHIIFYTELNSHIRSASIQSSKDCITVRHFVTNPVAAKKTLNNDLIHSQMRVVLRRGTNATMILDVGFCDSCSAA